MVLILLYKLSGGKLSLWLFIFQVVLDRHFKLDDLQIYIKDFFYEVFHEMVSAESGMFMFNDSKMLAWFPSKVRHSVLIQENIKWIPF